MKKEKLWGLTLSLLLLLIVTGCTDSQATKAKVESGVNDKGYVGIVSPQLPQEYQIDKETREEMIKYTISGSVDNDSQISEENAGELDEAKPKI